MIIKKNFYFYFNKEPPIDPSIVGVPYLNHEAIDLLSNCCTSKEFDLWQSLGPNWVQPLKVREKKLIPVF